MNLFDMLAIVIVAFCVIRGMVRGLIKEISSIIGVLAGFYAAYTYYTFPAGLLSSWFSDPAHVNIISFLLIFCIVFLVISMLGVVIKYVLNIAFLGWFDRVCGIGFGLLKGILLVSVLLIIFTAFLPKGAPLVKESVLAPHMTVVSEKMARVVSRDMKQQFAEKIEELKKTWEMTR